MTNTVDPAEILARVLRNYKVTESHVEWIYHLLTNRTISVNTREGKLNFRTSIGVLQGDPASPSMFNAYTINVHRISDDKSCIVLQYADDFILIIFDRKKENLPRIIQRKKAEFVHKLSEKKVRVNGISVEIVDKITFIGYEYEIDQKLNFAAQFETLCDKL